MKNDKNKILIVYPNVPGMLVISLAIGLFTAILRRAGFEVELFDATLYVSNVSFSPEKRVEYLQARKFSYREDIGLEPKSNLISDFTAKVDSFKPDLLLFSVVEDAFRQALTLLDAVKDKNIPTVVGGVFPTAAPDKVISYPQIKILGLGEGEGTVLEAAQRVREGRSLNDIPNTWIKKKDGAVIKNAFRPLVNLDKSLLPDFSLFDKARFFRPMGGRILKTIPLETARGCPYRCTYCNSPMWNEFYREKHQGIFLRHKSIGRLMEEIGFLADKYQPELLYIIDDTFLARSIEEIREFAELYQKFKIPFWMNTRPETLTEEKLNLLKETNCYRMSIGVECGSEEFRKQKLNRYAPNKEILEKIEMLAKSGLAFSINNIIGFPGETREMIFETIEFNRQLSGYDTLTVSIFTPYHGTKLREEAVQKGYMDPEAITTHTTSSSLLKMPQLSQEEIDGLMRTFTMYVGFPKKWWEYIKKAEKFTPEGNEAFNKLKEIYYKTQLSGDQFQKLKKAPQWGLKL